MPDASHYLRQANALLSMSLDTSNPVVAAKFWEIAADYLAKAVRLGAFSAAAVEAKGASAPAWPQGLSGHDPGNARDGSGIRTPATPALITW